MSHVIPRGKGGHWLAWPQRWLWVWETSSAASGPRASLLAPDCAPDLGIHSCCLSALAVRSCGCKQLRGRLFCYRHNTPPATPVKLQWLPRNSMSSEPCAAIRPCPQAPAHGPRFRCCALLGLNRWHRLCNSIRDPFGNQGALGRAWLLATTLALQSVKATSSPRAGLD